MYRIGVDLGGTNIVVGLIDDSYRIVAKTSGKTDLSSSEAIAREIGELCCRLCEENRMSVNDVASVGIASPGIVNSDLGRVEYANNLPFRYFPLCDKVREIFPAREIRAENDANAAAWGEAIAGAAKGTKDSVMITLGTGVGGGVIVNHKILSGFNYSGAELGHTVIVTDGVACSCGRLGCWESYSSATALIRMTKEKIKECYHFGRKTLMTEWEKENGHVSGKTAYACMYQGDEAAQEVVDTYIKYLAIGISNIINIFQPEVLSLGGGVSNEGQILVDQLKPKLQIYGNGAVPMTQLRIAQLKNDAGVIGAATLGIVD